MFRGSRDFNARQQPIDSRKQWLLTKLAFELLLQRDVVAPPAISFRRPRACPRPALPRSHWFPGQRRADLHGSRRGHSYEETYPAAFVHRHGTIVVRTASLSMRSKIVIIVCA